MIRKLTPQGTNWVVTTIAGDPRRDQQESKGTYADGPGLQARFCSPQGIAVDSAGNIYVADTGNSTIRKMTLVGNEWIVTTIAGGPERQDKGR